MNQQSKSMPSSTSVLQLAVYLHLKLQLTSKEGGNFCILGSGVSDNSTSFRANSIKFTDCRLLVVLADMYPVFAETTGMLPSRSSPTLLLEVL